MRKNCWLLHLIFYAFLLNSCDNSGNEPVVRTDTIHINTGSVPDTLQKLNEQITVDPDNAGLLHTRALYYLNQKEYVNSFNDLMQVLNIDSSKAPYYLTLSDVYFYTNKTGSSKRALERAVELDPKNTDALLKLAELYLYVKKNDKSIEYINKVLKLDQYNAKAYFMKGMNYKDLKDTARAISSMQTAVEQDQTYYHAYMQLGILTAAHKNPLAIQYYRNALRIQPNSTEALYAMGKFYQDAGNWENAIITYNTLIARDSHNKYARYNLGVIYLMNLKKYELAINHFTEAIQVDSSYKEAYFGRGVTYQSIANNDQAMKDYQQCLRIDPDYEIAKQQLKRMNKLK